MFTHTGLSELDMPRDEPEIGEPEISDVAYASLLAVKKCDNCGAPDQRLQVPCHYCKHVVE